MNLKNNFKNNTRLIKNKINSLLNKKDISPKKELKPLRFWDYLSASKFLKNYRSDIEFMAFEMLEDDHVQDIIIEDGKLIKAIDSSYQYGVTPCDGVLCTSKDTPIIHVIYKGGSEEYIACYKDVNGFESYAYSHRKIKNVSKKMSYSEYVTMMRKQ